MKMNKLCLSLSSLFVVVCMLVLNTIPVFGYSTEGTAGFAMEYYTVTFDTQGGSRVNPLKDVAYGSHITAPAQPQKADHTFIGWFKTATGGEQWDFAASRVKMDITLYAHWKGSSSSSGSDSQSASSSSTSSSSSSTSSSSAASSSSSSSSNSEVPSSVPSSSDGSSSSVLPASSTGPSGTTPTGGGETAPGVTPRPGGVVIPPAAGAGIIGTTTPTRPAADPADRTVVDDGGVGQTPGANIDQIVDDTTPLTQWFAKDSWALVNLIVVVIGLISSMATILIRIKILRSEEKKVNKKSFILLGLSILTNVLLILVFLITQNMSAPMVFADRWTIPMLIGLLLEVLLGLFSNRNKVTKEEEQPL